MITTDIVRQRRMPPQAPFSDAYINGLPPKRRKVCFEPLAPTLSVYTFGLLHVLHLTTKVKEF